MPVILFGVVFGFLLSRVGATDYDVVTDMFLGRDLHLAGVIGVAVLVAGPLLVWLRRTGRIGPGSARPFGPKARKPGNLVGGLLFGVGWALTGTCPGTCLAQIGEGKWVALATFGGMLLGAALYRRVGGRVESKLSRV